MDGTCRIKFGKFRGLRIERSRYCHKTACKGCSYCNTLPYVPSYLKNNLLLDPETTPTQESWADMVLDVFCMCKEDGNYSGKDEKLDSVPTAPISSSWLSKSAIQERLERVGKRLTKSQ